MSVTAERVAEATGIEPRIRSLSTRVPPPRLSQDEIRSMAGDLFRPRMPDFDRLEKIFGNAGVEWRHSRVPLRWFRDPHGWPERNRLYQAAAIASSRPRRSRRPISHPRTSRPSSASRPPGSFLSDSSRVADLRALSA